jgi:hypothetical protein
MALDAEVLAEAADGMVTFNRLPLGEELGWAFWQGSKRLKEMVRGGAGVAEDPPVLVHKPPEEESKTIRWGFWGGFWRVIGFWHAFSKCTFIHLFSDSYQGKIFCNPLWTFRIVCWN